MSAQPSFWTSVSFCGIHLTDSFLIWRLPWRILQTVPSECTSFRDISLIQTCGSAFTFFVTAGSLSSFEVVSGRLRGVTVFLSSPWNKMNHTIFWWWYVKKTWTLQLSPNLYEFSVCRLLSHAKNKMWKCSFCWLKCSVFNQIVNGWFKWCHINQGRITRITCWLEILTDERWHVLHIYCMLHYLS